MRALLLFVHRVVYVALVQNVEATRLIINYSRNFQPQTCVQIATSNRGRCRQYHYVDVTRRQQFFFHTVTKNNGALQKNIRSVGNNTGRADRGLQGQASIDDVPRANNARIQGSGVSSYIIIRPHPFTQ